MKVHYYDTFYVRLYDENDQQVYSVMDNGFEKISEICGQVCIRYESRYDKKVTSKYSLQIIKLDCDEFGWYKPNGRKINY